jgi:hypothetical protein
VLDPDVFTNLVGYIERGEIRPVVAAIFPLREIAVAQRIFLTKQHVGKIVLAVANTQIVDTHSCPAHYRFFSGCGRLCIPQRGSTGGPECITSRS